MDFDKNHPAMLIRAAMFHCAELSEIWLKNKTPENKAIAQEASEAAKQVVMEQSEKIAKLGNNAESIQIIKKTISEIQERSKLLR